MLAAYDQLCGFLHVPHHEGQQCPAKSGGVVERFPDQRGVEPVCEARHQSHSRTDGRVCIHNCREADQALAADLAKFGSNAVREKAPERHQEVNRKIDVIPGRKPRGDFFVPFEPDNKLAVIELQRQIFANDVENQIAGRQVARSGLAHHSDGKGAASNWEAGASTAEEYGNFV